MIDARQAEMLTLAGNDPDKLEQYKKTPLIEYYQILDAKIAETKKKIELGNNKH